MEKQSNEEEDRKWREYLTALNSTDRNEQENVLKRIVCDKKLAADMMHHVKYFGGSKQDAEDVVQHVYLTLVKKVEEKKLTEVTKLRQYLFGIAEMHWLNEKRKRLRHKTSVGVDENFFPNTDADPLSITQENAYVKALKTLLEGLGFKCQHLLTLKAEDYSAVEIAERYEIISKLSNMKDQAFPWDAARTRAECSKCQLKFVLALEKHFADFDLGFLLKRFQENKNEK